MLESMEDVAARAASDVLLREQIDVERWLRDEPGAWGALAGKATIASRELLGRPLTSDERRVVWAVTWARLLALRERPG